MCVCVCVCVWANEVAQAKFAPLDINNNNKGTRGTHIVSGRDVLLGDRQATRAELAWAGGVWPGPEEQYSGETSEDK